jgi:hypothetical protein
VLTENFPQNGVREVGLDQVRLAVHERGESPRPHQLAELAVGEERLFRQLAEVEEAGPFVVAGGSNTGAGTNSRFNCYRIKEEVLIVPQTRQPPVQGFFAEPQGADAKTTRHADQIEQHRVGLVLSHTKNGDENMGNLREILKIPRLLPRQLSLRRLARHCQDMPVVLALRQPRLDETLE